MRDKLIELLDARFGYASPISPILADQILALFKDAELKWYNAGWDDCMKSALDIRGFPSLEGIVVEEKCTNHLESPENLPYQICTICRTATGTITRQATIEEFIEWGINLLKTAEHSFGYETFKSISELPEGGRLRIREKD